MENILKYILGHKKRIMQIVAIIVVLIVVIIFSAAQYIITLDDGIYDEGNPGNTPYVVNKNINESALSEYLSEGRELNTKASKDGGYALNVDLDELTEEIIKELDKQGGKLNTYFSKGNLHEYLKKMIKAEYITQYPDLRSANKIGTEVPEGEFQGVIKFIRHKSDGSERILEYIPLGEQDVINGNTLYGLINQANGKGGVSESIIESAKSRVLNYFSIDMQGNLIVANWSRTITKTIREQYQTDYVSDNEEVDYSDSDKQNLNNVPEQINYEYVTHIINYKSSISKYRMPFNYLWAFLVCGRDEKFISDFTDLVLESQIEISVYDNLTEIEDKEISSYNSNNWKWMKTSERTFVDGRLDGSVQRYDWGSPQVINTTHNYEITYTKTYSNTIVIAVTYLDIWYMKYFANYTYDIEDSGTDTETTKLEPEKLDSPNDSTAIDSGDIQYTEGSWMTVSIRKEPIPIGESQVQSKDYVTIEEQRKVDIGTQTKCNQRVFISEYKTVQYKYTLDGDPEVTEKIDPKLKEGDEGYPNFCALYSSSHDALRNISGVESRVETWLFEILESNIDTANMVELTKYMLYCATGKNYGVTEYDFSIYAQIELSNFVSGSGLVVDTSKSSQKMVLTKEQIRNIITTKYSGQQQTNLLGVLDDLMYIQENYNVNAVFAIAVVTQESSAGTNWRLISKDTYNWASITGTTGGGYVDKNGTSWRNYGSFSEATRDFGNLIANGTYYFKQGNCTVGSIGQHYCVPPEGWIEGVSNKMKNLYKSIGVQIGGEATVNQNADSDGYTGTYTNSSGRTFSEYKQYTGSWKSNSYASRTMKSKGCYPTSVAIIASSYNSSITPETVRLTKNSKGLASATGFFSSYGISSTDTTSSISEDDIKSALASGKTAMVYVTRAGGSTLTYSEHWIALLDVDGEQVYVSNPGSTSKTGWLDFSTVMRGLRRVIYVD